MSGEEAVDLVGRLRRLVLEAYADGVDVEGEWYLLTADSMIPNVTVTIESIDAGTGSRQDVDGAVSSGTFMQRLQDLLLDAFATGTSVTGSHVLRYAAPTIPDWRVGIVRECEPSEDDERSSELTYHRE